MVLSSFLALLGALTPLLALWLLSSHVEKILGVIGRMIPQLDPAGRALAVLGLIGILALILMTGGGH